MSTEDIKERITGTQAVAVKSKAEELQDLMLQMRPAFDEVLQRAITPERFTRIALSAFRTSPELMQCSKTSLITALMNSAAFGLEPNTPLGHAYLIPFKNRDGSMDVRFIIGYQGLIELARRSGRIITIHADVVYSKDYYEAYQGRDAMLKHQPYRGGDRGEIVTYYAYAQLDGGGFQFVEMTPTDIEAIRQRSRAKDNGPWVTDYESMCLKTVLRRLCKLLPKSILFEHALHSDEAADEEIYEEVTADD